MSGRVKVVSFFVAMGIFLSAVAILILVIPFGLPPDLVRWYTIGIVGLHVVIDTLYFMFWKPVTKPRSSVKKGATS